MKKLFSISFIIFFFSSSSFLITFSLLIWLLTKHFDKRLVLLHKYTQLWGSLYISLVPGWHIKIKGKENINPKKVYMIVANHLSQLDILSASFLPINFKWVSKSEAFKVPIIGWSMRLNECVELKRGDKKSIIEMVKDASKAIDKGSSIFIFPEGTRSKTGEINEFKPGAFIIAKRKKISILPIAISGTNKILPRDGLNFEPKGNINYTILPEITYDEYKDMDTNEIAKIVQEKISNTIKS